MPPELIARARASVRASSSAAAAAARFAAHCPLASPLASRDYSRTTREIRISASPKEAPHALAAFRAARADAMRAGVPMVVITNSETGALLKTMEQAETPRLRATARLEWASARVKAAGGGEEDAGEVYGTAFRAHRCPLTLFTLSPAPY
jgi:hypothetical protein